MQIDSKTCGRVPKAAVELLASQDGADAARFSRALMTIKTDLADPCLQKPLEDLALRWVSKACLRHFVC